jgi:sarcosine oxidase
MKQHYPFVVIGAGGAGASTAYQLARQGEQVLLLEQFEIGHSRGSSHGHSRIFRFAYDIPDYVQLAQAAKKGWDALADESGITLLKQTGGLDLGPAHSRGITEVRTSLTSQGASFDELDPVQLARRFPQWKVPDDWAAIHSPDAGIVWPTQTVEVLVALAQSHGAEVREHTLVQQIEISPAGPVIHLADRQITADKLVVAAGAWLPKLLPQAQQKVRVALEATLFFRPQQPQLFTPEHFPIFITHTEQEIYGFPIYGLPGVKIASHHMGRYTTADTRAYEVEPAYEVLLADFLQRHLPLAVGPSFGARTCLYTNTANQDFWMDYHPESRQVLIASPCSGHGFKFVSVIGEILADLVRDRPHPLWFERFRGGW